MRTKQCQDYFKGGVKLNMRPRVKPVYYTLVPVDYINWANQELDKMINDVRKMNKMMQEINKNKV